MPEKVWEKIADFEQFEGEGEFLADYQPKVMRALLAHWQPAVVRLLTVGKARRAERRPSS